MVPEKHTDDPFGGTPAWSLNSVQQFYRHQVFAKLEDGSYRLESVPRCLCGSEGSVTIATQDRFGLPVGVIACTLCGLARTSPRLRGEDLPALYRDHYHGLHMGIPDPDPSVALFKVGQGAQIYELVKNRLSPMVRLAEVGCGTGQVMREFQAAASLDGIKVEAIGCEYAPAYVSAGLSAGSSIRLGPPHVLVDHGQFDVVIMSHVLEHFADPPRELSVISKLLVSDGTVFIEVPGIRAIHRKPEYDYDLRKYLTFAHTYHFSLGTLTSVMARAGFERIAGDETVRAVFRPADAVSPIVPDGADGLTDYLEWLRRSRVMRLKRLARHGRRIALHVFRRVFGDRAYEAVRRVTRRARSRR